MEMVLQQGSAGQASTSQEKRSDGPTAKPARKARPLKAEKTAKAQRARGQKGKRSYVHISVAVVALLLIVWTVFSLTGHADMRTVPAIQDVWAALVSITVDGYKGATLLGHLGASFFRLFTAFGLAIVTAIPLGLLSGHNAKIRAALEPIVEFIRPLPPLAYYTILILWMGIGDGSKIMLLYLACFAPIYVACASAVTKIPANYLNTAATLGASSSQTFWRVVLPYTAADIFTGIRTSIGHGYSTLVAAEMVAAASGIGWMILDAGNWLRSDVIFAGIIVMGFTGILINAVLLAIESRVVPWKDKL